MSNLPAGSSPKLHQIQTSAFSLGSGLLVVVASGLGIMQVMGLIDGLNPDKNLLIQLVPGALCIAIFGWVLLRGRRRGELSVYQDRLEGRRPNGLPIMIAMERVHSVDLKSNAVALKDQAGELLLVQQLPGKADGGLIWLLAAYRDWDASIWQRFAAVQTDALPTATRHFLTADGQPSFGDIGFIIQTPKETWYFPESPTVDIQGLGAGQMRMNQRATGQHETQLHFQPQPDWLPLSRLCMSILESPLTMDLKHDYIAELAENHGGCEIGTANEDGAFESECLGNRVMIFMTEE